MARVRPIETDQDSPGRGRPGISSCGTVGPDQETERGGLRRSLMAGLGARRWPKIQPERWLVDGTAAAAASSAKRISMPFGAGPRICPGRYLAMLEMKLAMAMLLSQFDIQAVDTPDGDEAREQLQFTMTPVGLRMRLAARA